MKLGEDSAAEDRDGALPGGRRSPAGSPLRFPIVLVGVVGAVCVLAALVIGTLRSRANAGERAATGVARLASSAEAQNALEWQAITQLAASQELRSDLRRARLATHRILDDLARTRTPRETLAAVARGSRAYELAVDRELGLLLRGDRRGAQEWDEVAVDPAFDELRNRLRAAGQAASSSARKDGTIADVGSLLVLLLTAGSIVFFAVRLRGSQAATVLAERERSLLRANDERFRSLMENASDMITLVDGDGLIRLQSESSAATLGRAAAQLVGRPLAELVHPDDRHLIATVIAGVERAGPTSVEWRLAHREGHWLHVETFGSSPSGEPLAGGAILTTRDMSERKALEEQLRHRAFHDPLTQLANRALFYDRVEHALGRNSREHGLTAVLFIDLDDFKVFNDRYGHAAGDELLVAVAKRLRGCLRSIDTAARLGGDEFGVLVEGVAGTAEAVQLADRILAVVRQPVMLHDAPVNVAPSIGIAVSSLDDVEAETLLRRADQAMYAAKRHGKDHYELFTPDRKATGDPRPAETAETADEVSWFMHADEYRSEVISVLSRPDGIVPVFQPIVDLRTGVPVAYEALARFDADSRRPPNAWFAQAHGCGLGNALEAQAIRAALAAGRPPDGAWLSINVSPSAIFSPEVEGSLPADLGGIVVEITENELVSGGERLADGLAALRARGAHIAIDDAGSGYAGFRQLMHLRPDVVKLDRGLVSGIDDDPAKAALVDSFVRFAHRIGASVCAEGIERLAELRMLADLDVTTGQGYVLARPAPPWARAAADAAAACRESFHAALEAVGAEPLPGEPRTLLERLAARLVACSSPAEAGACVDEVCSVLDAHAATVSRVRGGDGLQQRLVSWTGQGASKGESFPLAAYPATARLLRSGRAAHVMISDPRADPAEVALLEEGDFGSMLMVPLIARGEPVGLLEVFRRDERPFSRRQISLARTIGHQLAMTLSHSEERWASVSQEPAGRTSARRSVAGGG